MNKNSSLRLGFVCHPYHRGGVTRWMADAAIYAAKNGYEVYFVTVVPKVPFYSSGGRETMYELMAPYANIMRLVTEAAGHEFELGSEAYRMDVYRRLIKEQVPNGTYLIPSDDKGVWDAVGSLTQKYAMVGVLHGDQDYYYERARDHARHLTVCATVSGRIEAKLRGANPGIANERIFKIPCGILLRAGQRVENSSGRGVELAFVGRLTDYEKRAYDLVNIAAELHKNDVPFHLTIAGNSAESAVDFGGQFGAVGCGDMVTFLGWQDADSVAKLLLKTDILLLTSNSEGMPIVMMEGLAAGAGFVGTRVSGIEDYEHSDYGGYCFGVYGVGEVKDAVQEIIRIAQVPKSERSAKARQLAEEEFGMGVCVNRYIAAIESVSVSAEGDWGADLGWVGKVASAVRARVRKMKLMVGR